MSRLDPVSLRLFVQVVESGTLAAAAALEHISSAAVSKRLSELETVLKTQLLHRSNKGVLPTPAGLALLKLARSALQELDLVRVQMDSFSRGTRGLVRVCASMSAITQFLAEPLRQFVDRHPAIQLQLEEKTSPQVVQSVADNAADMGIYLPVVHGRELQAFAFRQDRLAVIVPKGHALARRRQVSMLELLDFDLVGIQSGSAIQIELSRAATSLDKPLKQRIQVSSFDALCSMVSQGLGVGVMPHACAIRHALSTPLHILKLTDAVAERQFLLGVRQVDALPVAARLLFEHLLPKASMNGEPAT